MKVVFAALGQEQLGISMLSAVLRRAGHDTRLVRPPTADLAAYEAYLKGRFQWNQRSEATLLESLRSFAQAVEVDPGFTLAHAALAEAYVTLAIYGVRAPTEATSAGHAMATSRGPTSIRASGASRPAWIV